jgi:hypothetical protein
MEVAVDNKLFVATILALFVLYELHTRGNRTVKKEKIAASGALLKNIYVAALIFTNCVLSVTKQR